MDMAMPATSTEPVMQDSLESLQAAIGAESVEDTQMRIEDMADSTALNPVWDAEPDKRIVLTMVRGTEIIGVIAGVLVHHEKRRHIYYSEATFQIHGLRVSEEGQGYGARLLLEAQRRVLDRAPDAYVDLRIPEGGQCHRNVDTCRFYLKCGWTVTYDKSRRSDDWLVDNKTRLQKELDRGIVRLDIRHDKIARGEHDQYRNRWRTMLQPARPAVDAEQEEEDSEEEDSEEEEEDSEEEEEDSEEENSEEDEELSDHAPGGDPPGAAATAAAEQPAVDSLDADAPPAAPTEPAVEPQGAAAPPAVAELPADAPDADTTAADDGTPAAAEQAVEPEGAAAPPAVTAAAGEQAVEQTAGANAVDDAAAAEPAVERAAGANAVDDDAEVYAYVPSEGNDAQSWYDRMVAQKAAADADAPPATTAAAVAEETERQRVFEQLKHEATGLACSSGVWSMRLPDRNVEVPAAHADLVTKLFKKWFFTKCIAANGEFVSIVNSASVSEARRISKLKVEVMGDGGRCKYTGLKKDTQCPLEPAFVRAHFKEWFLLKCASAEYCGEFVPVPIGASEGRPTPSGASLGAPCEPASSSTGGLDSCRKPVKYRDGGGKDLCAPYGLASALHDLGARGNQGNDLGAHIAKRAPKLAKARGKGSGGNDKDAVTACVDEMRNAGWPVTESFTERGSFSPTKSVSRNPTLVQLTEQHAVATVEDDDGKWVFDSNEEHALPLTHESLSRCMGEGRVYTSGSAVRAYRFAPGKKARAATKRNLEACAASAAPTENACPNSPSKKARADVAPLATKA